jgi:mRNA interferase MazF
MKRGDIYFAQLDPTIGSEIQKTRPVIIVSNDVANRSSNLLTVIPLTSSVQKIYPFEVGLLASETGLTKTSKALAQQIRTLDKRRLAGRCQGNVQPAKMKLVDDAIRLHLSLI